MQVKDHVHLQKKKQLRWVTKKFSLKMFFKLLESDSLLVAALYLISKLIYGFNCIFKAWGFSSGASSACLASTWSCSIPGTKQKKPYIISLKVL